MLDRAPQEVLEHIALLTASRGPAPPSDLCALLTTCSAVYRALNTYSNPHLYAAIFRLKYGNDDSVRGHRTDSSLAAELRQRCSALRRCRGLDMSSRRLRQDLWTLLCMTLEAGGRCDALAHVGFSAYIVQVARCYLREDAGPDAGGDIKGLLIWLLCLGLSRHDIRSQIAEVRSTLVSSLRPFVSTEASVTSLSPSAIEFHPASEHKLCSSPPDLNISTPPPTPPHTLDPHAGNDVPVADEEFMCYYNEYTSSLSLPPSSDAAVVLIFALKEAVPLQIPYHLPATRSQAVAENRPGPTAEEYTAFQQAVTLLFSDIHQADPATAAWVADLVSGGRAPAPALGDVCTPGSFAGVWEGSMMISSCGSSEASEPDTLPDFLCRTPMQCELEELSPQSGWNQGERRDLANTLIVGQTSPEHEESWGYEGFTFAGTARENGEIVFTRGPKHPAGEHSEAWIFIGRLCYGKALVGTFRSSVSNDARGVSGIFSLHKRDR